MEKGLIRYANAGTGFTLYPLEWYSDETFQEYGKFPKSFFLYPDLRIFGTRREICLSEFEAYRCENCGAILIIPPEDDTEQNEDQ